ncbi:hypothetical protein QTL97_03540 [Sporosarcina thermotolerans]|uniref:Uncharacterized protein n=1 Tax=Sporosarcina thermotolerans TaxID=633404 RepID=A0AAW9A8P2_9BACL|nr:hypothetical protein [Sporosarcina thermotolerans]MDW0116016.1 hypothetical protein [Sporosarcina thermotolerans]WHT49801.1 hypothetical protein QNH10_10295 [Sporosarcina thermotolerans]
MTIEEAENYGRSVNARNAAVERNIMSEEQEIIPANQLPPPLNEEEIKKRVGAENFRNLDDAKVMNSINS